ncbi:MAG: DAK2 domain-containing protein [Chloroflexota bacterium]
MTGDDLHRLLDAALETFVSSADELRDLDAATGDGDLGVTVRGGVAAAQAALSELEPGASPADVVRAVASAIARSNPATFSTLSASALLAAAKAIDGIDDLGRSDLLRFGRAAADTIALRGKATLGDKTVLDALVPSLDAAEAAASDESAFEAAVGAARQGVDTTAALVARRGRAAWIGERGRGHPDAGATAYLRFLEAIGSAWSGPIDG